MVKKFSLILIFLLLPFYAYPQSTDVSVESLKISHITTVVSVGNAVTLLPTTALSGRKTIMIQNVDTVIVYLGNSSVTANENSTGGYQLGVGASVTCDFTDDILLYGIVAAGSANVVVWEAR